MKKSEAHAILNRCREFPVSLALTNQALECTGDIQRLPNPALRANGYEQGNDRPCALHDTPVGERVGWSRYLDCKTNQGVTP